MLGPAILVPQWEWVSRQHFSWILCKPSFLSQFYFTSITHTIPHCQPMISSLAPIQHHWECPIWGAKKKETLFNVKQLTWDIAQL